MKPTRFMRVRPALLSFVLLIASLLLNAHLFAQGNGSSISGFVYNEDNKPAENATINVSNINNGFTATTITNKKGYFILRELPVGVYTIHVSEVNAATQVLKNNMLNFGDHLVLQQIILSNKINTMSEVVVKSSSFTNSVDRLGTGTFITSRTLQKIPIATRFGVRYSF